MSPCEDKKSRRNLDLALKFLEITLLFGALVAASIIGAFQIHIGNQQNKIATQQNETTKQLAEAEYRPTFLIQKKKEEDGVYDLYFKGKGGGAIGSYRFIDRDGGDFGCTPYKKNLVPYDNNSPIKFDISESLPTYYGNNRPGDGRYGPMEIYFHTKNLVGETIYQKATALLSVIYERNGQKIDSIDSNFFIEESLPCDHK